MWVSGSSTAAGVCVNCKQLDYSNKQPIEPSWASPHFVLRHLYHVIYPTVLCPRAKNMTIGSMLTNQYKDRKLMPKKIMWKTNSLPSNLFIHVLFVSRSTVESSRRIMNETINRSLLICFFVNESAPPALPCPLLPYPSLLSSTLPGPAVPCCCPTFFSSLSYPTLLCPTLGLTYEWVNTLIIYTR